MLTEISMTSEGFFTLCLRGVSSARLRAPHWVFRTVRYGDVLVMLKTKAYKVPATILRAAHLMLELHSVPTPRVSRPVPTPRRSVRRGRQSPRLV